MFLFILFIWHSVEPWKSALLSVDVNYLSVPPIFAIVWPKQYKNYSKPIFCDLLSVGKKTNQDIILNEYDQYNIKTNFSAHRILNDLNYKKNPQKLKKDLFNYCIKENISQACLILGRIYEFGAYNETDNLSLSYFFYNRVLSLNDSSANSPLSFFHRHIYPNMPLSIIDDYSSHSIESILTKSIQFENGFGRPLSCQKVSKELILVSDVLADMYFQQPGPYIGASLAKAASRNERKTIRKNEKMVKNNASANSTAAWEMYKEALVYLVRPYPSDDELRMAKVLLTRALRGGCKEALPLLARLQALMPKNAEKSGNEDDQDKKTDGGKGDESGAQSKKSDESGAQSKKVDESGAQSKKVDESGAQSKKNDESGAQNKNGGAGMQQDGGLHYDRDDYPIFKSKFPFDENHPVHQSELLTMIEPLIERGDPEALLLASGYYMRSSAAIIFKPHLSASIIQSIAESEYPPAIHRLGELTYFGLMQIKRSAKDAFILYAKAASCGYNPSILAAAKQLVGGDGVCEDCESAVSLLRGIIDVGPWSDFYDKFVLLKKSKVAFLRMVEMGLTPPIWLDDVTKNDIEMYDQIGSQKVNDSDVFDIDQCVLDLPDSMQKQLINYVNFLNRNPPFCSLITAKFLSVHSLPMNLRNDHYLEKIRLARKGDSAALFWLVMHSNISDSLRWLERLESFPINTFYLSRFLKVWIVVKSCLTYRSLAEFEKLILKMIVSPFFNDLLIFLVTSLFVFFITIRIHYYLS
ncbi:hypothetical protein M9Y10_018089 [Tritrichomonas musculus]|uniref:Uncharacterized protein n=1 Tax=Tritrichomonas musculus TaxID=1915356 RepID=A0ABR2GPE5_9EUKA